MKRHRLDAARWLGVLLLAALAIPGHPHAQSEEDQPLRPSGLILPERAEVNVVLVDVLVRGRDGTPVRGLEEKDFELYIDRLPAPIDSIESYCPPEGTQAVATGGEGTGEAEAPVPAVPHHIVLFFDINHLTRQGKERSFDAALDYVREEMRPGDRVMLLAMKGDPILLESFTDDREVLAARLEEVKADDGMLDMSYLEERVNILDILSRECGIPGTLCQRRVNVALPYVVSEFDKARRSLETLSNLMPALSAIRGRKTIVYFSETLRDTPGLEYLILGGSTPKGEGLDLTPWIQDVQREANAAGVSLYPVWATGLGEGSGSGLADASVTVGEQDVALVQESRVVGEDSALSLGTTFALETGGVSLKRTNDIGRIFTAVNDDLGCYYVLAYKNEGSGDGKRHSIIVKVDRKRTSVRHRPYFMDWSESERLDRQFRSALLAPDFFRGLAVSAEAFPLAPRTKKIPLLLKVEFPLDEITLFPQAGGRRYGEAEVRGTVWTGSEESCKFARRIPLIVEPGEAISGRKVIYEAGCELPPGDHRFTGAVLDAGTWTLGAAEISVPVSSRRAGIFGDVLLWTSSAGDLLFAGDASAVGIHDAGSGHGFVPRSTRRFNERESGVLYVIVCPPDPDAVASDQGILVTRTLFAGDTAVASFPPVRLGETRAEPEEGTVGAEIPAGEGCEGFFSPIPPGQLGPGGYVMEVRVEGITAEPLVHRAGFALSEEGDEPGS